MGWWDLLLWYNCTDPFEEDMKTVECPNCGIKYSSLEPAPFCTSNCEDEYERLHKQS